MGETLMAMMASMGGSLGGGATSVSVGTSPGTGLATIQEEMAKKQEEATCGLMNPLTCVHSQSSCAAFATAIQNMTGGGSQQAGSQMSMGPQLTLPALDNQAA